MLSIFVALLRLIFQIVLNHYSMKQQTKKFEQQYIRVRNQIERKGVTLAKRMIAAHYVAYMEKLKQLGISSYQAIEIPEVITERFFKVYYPMSAPLAVMTYENLEKNVKFFFRDFAADRAILGRVSALWP